MKNWLASVRNRLYPVARGRKTRPAAGQRLQVRPLEDRLTPSTFTVNTFADTTAVNLTTGKDATGHVSLRSAIQAADHLGGTNVIDLPAGTYNLTIAPTGTDDASSGDLNITCNLTINGAGDIAGSPTTTIDGGALDRVFQVAANETVRIAGVIIQNGKTSQGGGISNAGRPTPVCPPTPAAPSSTQPATGTPWPTACAGSACSP
jgi:hypothetical protein